MNGSEVETRRINSASPEFVYGQVPELTEPEKMDLTVFSSMPVAKAVYKLMELEILQARNEAMRADPSNREKQLSLMTIAHAMDKFYINVRAKIEHALGEHIADVRLRAQEEELKDQKFLEEVIHQNTIGKL